MSARARKVLLAEAFYEALDAACSEPMLDQALERVGMPSAADAAWVRQQLFQRLDRLTQKAFKAWEHLEAAHAPRKCPRGHDIPPSKHNIPRTVCPHPDCARAHKAAQTAAYEARKRKQGWTKTHSGWMPPPPVKGDS